MTMHTRFAKRALRQGLPAWRSQARAGRDESLRLCRSAVKACLRADVRRPMRIALHAARRQASLQRSLVRPIRRHASAGLAFQARVADGLGAGISRQASGFAPGEKGTLELGTWIVLGTLGLGLQVGRWPAWTALAAAGGYIVWVVAYSEATVQARRRLGGRPPAPTTFLEKPPAAPPQE